MWLSYKMTLLKLRDVGGVEVGGLVPEQEG